MKKTDNMRLIVLTVLAACLCFMMGGGADKGPSPQDTILALRDTINSLDMDALLNCIPSIAFTILQTEVEVSKETVHLSGDLIWGSCQEMFSATVTLPLEEDARVITGIH